MPARSRSTKDSQVATREGSRTGGEGSPPAEGGGPDSASLNPLEGLSLERAAKGAAIAGLLLYALGLIAVNGYLSRFGFTDLSELKTRFVFTGALFVASVCAVLVLLALAVGIPILVGKFVDTTFRRLENALKRAPAWLNSLAKWVFGGYLVGATVSMWLYALFIPWFVLVLFLQVAGNQDEVTWNALELYLASAGLGISAWGVLFFGFGRVPPPRHLRFLAAVRQSRAAVALAISVGAALVLLVYLPVLFGRHVYPRVPERYGGGRPVDVQFVFAVDDVKTARQLGLEFETLRPQLSEPVCLLYKGDDSYLISLGRGAAVRMNSDLAVGIHGTSQTCEDEI